MITTGVGMETSRSLSAQPSCQASSAVKRLKMIEASVREIVSSFEAERSQQLESF